MNRTLILIRHAHRETSNRALDNGLSDKGVRQARWIREFASRRFSKVEWRKNGGLLLTSPKRRCLETLEPFAKWAEAKIDARLDLEEQRHGETQVRLQQRIETFLTGWREQTNLLTVACTHGDWLPLALQSLLGEGFDVKKGGWVEIELANSRPQLRWYIPSFKHFYAD